jgi:hypothetical protein
LRTISSTILAAQKDASSVPYLRAVVHDRIGGVRRLGFERLYDGVEPDGYHAAAMAGDGSLSRARVAGGTLYYQRIVSPGPGGAFDSWTDLGSVATADVALCADGSRVLLFYVDTDVATVRVRESTDNGATLSSPVTAASAAGVVTWLAAAIKADGDALLLYSVGAAVYCAKRVSGVWGSPVTWTNSVASVSGLACHHHLDWNVAVAGADTDGTAYLWTCIFGDGVWQSADTWSALREVMRASTGSNVTYRAPFLGRPDVDRLTVTEKFTGTTAYSRAYHSHSLPTAVFAENRWREPVPFDHDTEYGLAIAVGLDDAWFCSPSGVWRASLDTPELDLSADVLEAEASERPFGGSSRLVLRNDDGRYSNNPAPLRTGAELEIGVGYETASGVEYSEGPRYWIDSVERQTGGGRGQVEIRARDASGLLAEWRARRQYSWSAGEETVFGILRFLFGRAGLDFSSVSASAPALSRKPAFTVHAGESGLTAVRRLIDTVSDVLLTRGAVALMKDPVSSESTAYAYGIGHEILAGRYREEAAPSNRAQVFGEGVFAEAFDWPAIALAQDRTTQVIDANVTTAGDAEDRAEAILRGAAMEAVDGQITIRPNAAQELYDVVEVTDPIAGLYAAKRRVLRQMLRYSSVRGGYVQLVELGGV